MWKRQPMTNCTGVLHNHLMTWSSGKSKICVSSSGRIAGIMGNTMATRKTGMVRQALAKKSSRSFLSSEF
jgi:hypothetical protein